MVADLPSLILSLSIVTSQILGLIVGFLAVSLLAQKAIVNAWERYRRTRQSELVEALEAYLATRQNRHRRRLEGLSVRERWIFKSVLLERANEAAAGAAQRLEELYELSGFSEQDLHDLKRSWFWWKRAAAAHHLGQARVRRAKPHLIKALKDPNTEVRLEATWALGHMHYVDTLPFIMESMSHYFKIAALRMDNFIFEMGKSALPLLLDLCRHPEQEIKLLAVHLVGEFKDTEALTTLLEMLSSSDMEIKLAAGKALGALGDPAGLEALLSCMQDPAWAMRAQAAKQAGRNAYAPAIPHLLRGLEDREWWVRFNSGEAISKMGPSGEKALDQAATGSTDRYARDMANQWLDELKATR